MNYRSNATYYMVMDLFDRVQKGDLDYIKKVTPDILLNARDNFGSSVISAAIKGDKFDCCKEILQKCPSLLYFQININKFTLLHESVSQQRYTFMDYFLIVGLDAANEGSFKKWIKLKNYMGDTALTMAASKKLLHYVKRLIEVDRDYKLGLLGIPGYKGMTALQLAVENQDHEMIKLLTDDGEGDPYSDYIPYSIAMDLFDHVRKGDLDYIKTVRSDVLLKSSDEFRRSVISAAIDENKLDSCKEILKKCPSLLYFQQSILDKNTLLHDAIYRHRYNFINYFLSVGLDAATNEEEGSFRKWINLKNFGGLTALSMATFNQCLHTVKRLIEVDREYKLGLSGIPNSIGKTALQMAVENQDHEMIKLLTGDYSDYIPYSIAMDLFIHVKNGDLDYVKTVTSDVLLKSRDEIRNSALSVATQYNQLGCSEEILKRCPKLLYHQNKFRKTVLHNSKADYKLVDFIVGFGLDMATIEGNTDNMQCFKNWISSQNLIGDTTLTLAVGNHRHDIAKRLNQVDRQYKLGLSEIVGSNMRTPLQLASDIKDQEMIKLLTEGTDLDLEHGANTDGNISLSIATTQDQEALHTGNNSNSFAGTDLDLEHGANTDGNISLSIATTQDQEALHTGNNSNSIAGTDPDFEYGNIDLDSLSLPVDLFDRVKSGDLDYIKTIPLDVLQNTRDEYLMSALSIATIEDQLDCCREILRRCPLLLYHQNNTRNTVLHHATYHGNGIFRLINLFVSAGLHAAKNEDDKGMERFKMWIKLQNDDGDTGLTQAAYYRNHDIVKIFVELDQQYKLGLSQIAGYRKKTAMEWALEYQDLEMIKLLLDLHNGNISDTAGSNRTQTSLLVDNSCASLNHIKTSEDVKYKSGTSVASEHKMFTLGEVSKHNNSKDCWLVINDKVYDVTKFLETHPGGDKVLLKATGKDATNDFKLVHAHSSNAIAMMDLFYVGVYDSITSLLTKLASDKPQPYSHEQLVDFTENFSHSLGSGGFGDVYKGKLPNGVLIAVKVLKDIDGKEKIMKEQFAAEVETMGRTYHRNLIRLYGYCYEASTKFKALIYDYMEIGSFDTVLFEKKHDLSWERLHNIAKEIAHGISYLHESCYPQIIHQDIKPANILLDSNFSPKVIDFGLAKVNMGESQFEQTKIKGTRNYMAPEVNQPNQVRLSCKCDVYSFGMMMFDILGSKRNHLDKKFWFPSQVWEKFSTNQLDEFILDCGIKEDDKDNAKRLSIVALLCVEHNPAKRPMMSTVVKMLEGKIKLDTPITPFYPNFYPASDSSSMSDSRDA